MTKDEMNKQLLQQVDSLTSTVDSLNATINAQTQLIAQLNRTIQELKEQLNKNSKNSSKPQKSRMDGLSGKNFSGGSVFPDNKAFRKLRFARCLKKTAIFFGFTI